MAMNKEMQEQAGYETLQVLETQYQNTGEWRGETGRSMMIGYVLQLWLDLPSTACLHCNPSIRS